MGYSFGASVSYQLAIAHPELVKKLVIISGVYKNTGWRPEVQKAIEGITPEMFANTPMKHSYDSLAPDSSHWSQFITRMVKFAGERFDLGDENIRKLASPVLLIMGDNDGCDLTYTARTSQLLGGNVSGDMAGIPKPRLAIIPGTSHVSLMSKTREISGLVLPFLGE